MEMADQSSDKGINDVLSTAKHQIIAAIVLGVCVWGGSSVAFYFNVQNTINNQQKAIERNMDLIEKMNSKLQDKADQSDIKDIKNSIRDINKTQKDIYRILIKQKPEK